MGENSNEPNLASSTDQPNKKVLKTLLISKPNFIETIIAFLIS